LKQIGLACLNHESAQGHLPAGGWGWAWVGDPDQGFGKLQPGGWPYNCLPFMEQQALHETGKGQDFNTKRTTFRTMVSTPLTAFNCPTRRRAIAYPTYIACVNVEISPSLSVGRTDYGGNCGINTYVPHNGGPSDLASGANWPVEDYRGIFAQCSTTAIADIKDGTSNTVMVGEKYLNPDSYATGLDGADNESLYVGNDNDVSRIAWYDPSNPAACRGPMQDRAGIASADHFGSAHGGACNFLFCDGSVHSVSYSVDILTFTYAIDRKDAKTTGIGVF